MRNCIGIARRNDKCTGKKFFHKLLRKTLRSDRNRSKTSESVTTDSRRARPPAEKFSQPSAHRTRRASKILFLRVKSRRAIAALHPNRM